MMRVGMERKTVETGKDASEQGFRKGAECPIFRITHKPLIHRLTDWRDWMLEKKRGIRRGRTDICSQGAGGAVFRYPTTPEEHLLHASLVKESAVRYVIPCFHSCPAPQDNGAWSPIAGSCLHLSRPPS
ncbi:hypothetical protein TREMEDRAFT_65212 [Tremella mesenterica DSM 1558]|uniref:uncharacterized protein n=1 Tax=Tremella mesenterica (strain ATCC 24925 / CBS 8224 / DSM 1558 / NBRC 9311 / NRRL Y-6157 / RJB 2259-6 / UBC 559-6) TaxID=578456 RepID=UPI00032B9B18|nr:uncharacterized protein TREMEDRAFT_65212 [Tremella mesenterica DSM 1558]EIW66808.1 hypothetical protein TREMEDRAFT_65212 [Tremella mesenterica DSM 1558]